MITLGIETSCDETSVGIIKDSSTVLGLSVHSQIKQHSRYGGVVPEIASRLHVKHIVPAVELALEQANISLTDVELIAGTQGPGLLGALSTGYMAAKMLAYTLKKPFTGVHHIEAHIFANFLDTDELLIFPALALVASGGHTQLITMSDWFKYELIGNTLDDAIGEAFDKSSRLIGLGYPGGPIIDKLARQGNKKAFQFPTVKTTNPLDFSFSGLKTAVLHMVKEHRLNEEDIDSQKIKDFCASLQNKLITELTSKTIKAAEQHNIKTVIIAGGVSANSFLRESLEQLKNDGYTIHMPQLKYCTDNGAMIASAGYHRFKHGYTSKLNSSPKSNLSLFY